MNFYIVAVAVVVALFSAHSTGLELSLCIKDGIENGCSSGNDLSSSNANNKNTNSAESKMVLDGYNAFNGSLAAQQTRSTNGMIIASRMLDRQPAYAAQVAQAVMQDAEDKILDAEALLLLSLSDALSASTDPDARQRLGLAIQKLQLLVIEAIEQLRAMSSLANRVVSAGGDPAKEAVDLISQIVKSVFAALYEATDLSYQQAINRSPVKSNQDADDSDASDADADAAIAEINKAADDAIRNNSSAAKVNRVRPLLIKRVKQIARQAADVRKYYTYVADLAESDRLSALNVYLAESKGVCNSLQGIFANTCLDVGSSAAQASDSSRKQIASAIRLLILGNLDVVASDKNAKYFTLLAMLFADDDVRKSGMLSGAQSGRLAKTSGNRGVVDAAKITFNAARP